jgi:hypothetical protein
VRWHLVESNAVRFDFSSVNPMLEAAARHGIQVVWDLCHYGWPQTIDLMDPAFIERFARFAGAVSEHVRDHRMGGWRGRLVLSVREGSRRRAQAPIDPRVHRRDQRDLGRGPAGPDRDRRAPHPRRGACGGTAVCGRSGGLPKQSVRSVRHALRRTLPGAWWPASVPRRRGRELLSRQSVGTYSASLSNKFFCTVAALLSQSALILSAVAAFDWPFPRIGRHGLAILQRLYRYRDRSHDRHRCTGETRLRSQPCVSPRLGVP